MRNATLEVITAIISADRSIGEADRARLTTLVREGGAGAVGDPLLNGRIVRRSEVARMLGRSVSSVDRLVRSGIINKVVFPGRQRSAGFRLSDVARLVAGGSEE